MLVLVLEAVEEVDGVEELEELELEADDELRLEDS